MSRVETSILKLGAWDEGDNPGAGSKTVVSANTGLNGNWLILDTAVGIGHTAAGAHAADVIDGPNLKTTVADGVAIQLTGTPLKLNLKDGGIATAKIADDAVTAAKLADACIDAAAKLAADVVITAKILDANVTLAKLAADSVDATKITHDNNRTKVCFTCAINTVGWDGYASFHGATLANNIGIIMPHAGSLMKVTAVEAGGNVVHGEAAYAAKPFSQYQRLTVYLDDGNDQIIVTVVGTATHMDVSLSGIAEAAPILVVLDVEFDDAD